MRGGRPKLPVRAAISAVAREGNERVWSLRGGDLEQLAPFRDWVGKRRMLLVSGEEGLVGPLAVALAATAAGSGLRTVLLECDLAQPRLAAELGLRASPGLHEYLRWEATPQEVLQPLTLAGPAAATAEHPLVCIVAGRQAADPKVLFGLQSFRHMTAKLDAAYDLAVIAGPALLDGADGLLTLAEQAEGMLVAIAPGQRSGKSLRSVRTALRGLPVEPVGAVVVGDGETV